MSGYIFDLPDSTHADIQIYRGSSPITGDGWQMWHKRRGVTMVYIFVCAGGGGGGNGAVGAAGTAAGGGGGGSGGQATVLIPAHILPDQLHVCAGYGGAANTSGTTTRVSVYPETTINAAVIHANGGGGGGNAAGATAGSAGAGGGADFVANQNLIGAGQFVLTTGQAGIVGGTTVAGANLTLPTTGLFITGGAGGGGVPASGAGSAGGSFNVSGAFPIHSGGNGGSSTTIPGENGSGGYTMLGSRAGFSYGGTGGGSTNAAATGAGLFGGNGGTGGCGSGGGGGGGAFTGGTAGKGGTGGPGIVIIVSW